MGLAGTTVLWWVLHYTEWFEEIGGFLALGGALSWLAFVLRLISDERTKQLQSLLDARLLANPRTFRRVMLGMSIFAVAIFFVGTVELEAPGEVIDRSVDVRRTGATEGDQETVPARRAVRLLFVRWPFTAPELEVRVAGYPELRVSLSRWWWSKTRLRVPESFLRPVLLIRPQETTANQLRTNNVELKVTVTSGGQTQTRVIEKYDGSAVWVGCDVGVDVPTHIRESWAAELKFPWHPLASKWTHPVVFKEGPFHSLKPGDKVVVQLPELQQEVDVSPVHSFTQFPQEVVLIK